MGDHGNVKVVTEKSDLEKILKDAGGKLVVIDFSAKWCGPCKNIHPIYTSLSSKYTDAVFLTVDVDDAEQIAADYDVSSMVRNKNIYCVMSMLILLAAGYCTYV